MDSDFLICNYDAAENFIALVLVRIHCNRISNCLCNRIIQIALVIVSVIDLLQTGPKLGFFSPRANKNFGNTPLSFPKIL